MTNMKFPYITFLFFLLALWVTYISHSGLAFSMLALAGLLCFALNLNRKHRETRENT